MTNIDQAWNQTCGVLLGKEIGPLEHYESYLLKDIEPMGRRKSALSGKEVFVSQPERFSTKARFIANDEMAEYEKRLMRQPLDLDDLKDLDSAIRSLGERLDYCGNLVLGNSARVESSDMCANATDVLSSHEVYDSKLVAYSYGVRYGEYVFGSSVQAESKFCIQAFINRQAQRCLETMQTHFSSDCYYTANMEGCTDCLFSFNQRSKSRMIGNRALSKERYAALKAKLVEDIGQTLESKKEIPSILEIIGGETVEEGKTLAMDAAGASPSQTSPPNIGQVGKAFTSTTRVVLGKELGPLTNYEKWLQSGVSGVILVRSALSEKPVIIGGWPFLKRMMNKAVTMEEALALGKKCISEEEIEGLKLENASERLATIKFTSPDADLGRNSDLVECSVNINSSSGYRNTSSVECKSCAYSLWPRQSEYSFGCSVLFSSKFCLKCSNSSELTRCVEVDHSKACADCLYCHNCENVQDSMFCFNAKNKRYAIANVEVGKERYVEIKARLLGEMARRVEKGEVLPSIFGIGGK